MGNQIEEMAKIMCRICPNKCDDTSGCIVEDYAEAIYNKDYRKHIVAEWKAGNENGQYGYYCSNCKAGFTGENAEWIAKEHDFCPKCGAMMKGAEYGKAD